MSGWEYRNLVDEGIDPDDYECPEKDSETYRCSNEECEAFGEKWSVGGWFPPDYHYHPEDWRGGFADVFCVDYGEDVFCEWCEEQGARAI